MTNRQPILSQELRMTNDRIGMTCRFSDIEVVGFWVNNQTGEGYRITEDALKPGHSPAVGYVSINDQFTLVNTDPLLPISKLRKDTADLDLPVGF